MSGTKVSLVLDRCAAISGVTQRYAAAIAPHIAKAHTAAAGFLRCERAQQRTRIDAAAAPPRVTSVFRRHDEREGSQDF